MTPFEAAFLAVALGLGAQGERRRWAVALAPFVAWACAAPAGEVPALTPYAPLVAVLLAALAAGRHAPAAMVLCLPTYADPPAALEAAVLWGVSALLIDALDDRFEDAQVPNERRYGLRLVACAALFFALHPLGLT